MELEVAALMRSAPPEDIAGGYGSQLIVWGLTSLLTA
jgi:hypothetical protein